MPKRPRSKTPTTRDHLNELEWDVDAANANDEARRRDNVGRVLDLIGRVRKRHPSHPSHRDSQQDRPVSAEIAPAPSQSETLFDRSQRTPGMDAETDRQTMPHRIDRFVIRELLGQGGHGLVYRAYDPQLDREVALKIPRPETLLTDDLRARFVREAQSAAALCHPCIVPVYQSGSDGMIGYIAYQLIEGITLADWIAQHPGGADQPAESAELIAQLADAVQHAHQRGILHRDLKPGNVVLRQRNQLEKPLENSSGQPTLAAVQPLITDFGLAKSFLEMEGAEAAAATRSGSIIGTPAYMAPEQTRGSAAAVGPSCDVYALGAILYELLTGQPPFCGGSLLETLQQVQQSDPLDPRRKNPGIPIDLAAICLKSLEKSPAQRYGSAFELAEDLRRFLTGHSILARPVTPLTRLRKWWRRNPLLAASMTTAVAVTIVGLISTTALWLRADHLRFRAQQQGQALARQKQQLISKSRQLQSAIRDLFLEVAQSDEIKSPAAAPLRENLLKRANQFYVNTLAQQPDDPELRADQGETLFELARVHEYLGDVSGALDLIRQAILTVPDPPSESSDTLRLVRWHGYAAGRLHQLGRLQEAKSEFDRAMQIMRTAALPMDHPELDGDPWLPLHAWILIRQADLKNTQREMAAAMQLTDQAIEILERVPADEPLCQSYDYRFNLALAYWIQGRAFRDRGDFAANQQRLMLAIDLLHDIVADEFQVRQEARLQLAKCLYESGVSLSRQNLPERAREQYRAALDQLDQLPETLDLDLRTQEEYARISYSLAVADLLLEHYADAEAAVVDSLPKVESLIAQAPEERSKHLDSLADRFNLLYVIRVRDPESTLESAESAIRAAIERYRETLALRPDWIDPQISMVQALANLGNVLERQDRLDEASEAYDLAESKLEPIAAARPDWFKVRDNRCNLWQGRMHVALKRDDYSEAMRCCLRAQTLLNPQRPNHLLVEQAWITALQQQWGVAEQLLLQFVAIEAQGGVDYLTAAAKAAEISALDDAGTHSAAFQALVAETLHRGLPEDAADREDYLGRIRADPQLARWLADLED